MKNCEAAHTPCGCETLNRLGGRGAHRAHAPRQDPRRAACRGAHEPRQGCFTISSRPQGQRLPTPPVTLPNTHIPAKNSCTPVLEKMSASGIRILRPVAPPPDQLNAPTRYEIFHDVLAPAMLDWRRRYLQQRRKRFTFVAAIAAAIAVLLSHWRAGVESTAQQSAVESKSARSRESLAGHPVSAPAHRSATLPPTLVAIRETAAAVGTSAAAVICQGPPEINFRASKETAAPNDTCHFAVGQSGARF